MAKSKGLLLPFLLLALTGCSAQRPVLYPNERLVSSGRDVAEMEINRCLRDADAYVASGGRAGDVAGSAAANAGTGAVIGGAAGAAGGAIFGEAARGGAAGAAGGAAAGLTRGMISGFSGGSAPDPLVKSFVDRCLRDKGYDVIGWK